jgi:hypothetical protein
MDDLVWLNRMGIILNLCAGFMLAPELIGLTRLQNFENFIERIMSSIRNRTIAVVIRLRSIVPLYRDRSNLRFVTLVTFLTLFLTAVGLGYWYIIIVLLERWAHISPYHSIRIVSVYCILVVGYGLVAWLLDHSDKRTSTVIRRLVYWLGPFVAAVPLAVFLLITLTFGLLGVLLDLVDKVLDATLKRLQGNKRLQALIVSTGIVFFVAGNLLQLVATF